MAKKERPQKSSNQNKIFLSYEKSIDFLVNHPLIALIIIFFLGISLISWHLKQLNFQLIQSMAKQNASLYSNALTEFRTLYSSEVVERARSAGIDVRHDYLSHPGAIPLPATLSLMLGKHIADKETGAKTRLYSDYPFPWRTDGGPHDQFEREALKFLEKNPNMSFSRIEEIEGRNSIRYATADIMRKSCVECHNSHPNTPRRDWKEGDVRGILEVIHPLEDFMQETNYGLRNTSLLMISMTGMGLIFLSLVMGRLKRTSIRLQEGKQDLVIALRATEKALQEFKQSRIETEKALKDAEENKLKLERKTNELQKTNKFMVDREVKMIELKKEVKKLRQQLGLE